MQRLGRYEIAEEVGRGGMGVVYRAVDTAIERTVAMKVVRLSDYATPQEARTLRERLFREARAAGGLTHPNIVTVYDVGQEDETAYIVMEFVQGRSLDGLLAEASAPRPEAWCLQIIEAAARALDYAHARGVFHRDIKPANIIVQEDGTVKVADFGIAKLAWTKTMTEAGMVMGSPHYMAPEQLKGEPVSGRSDQFALAGLTYTLLTGRKPFEADTVATLFHKILYEEPVRPQELNASLSPHVEQVLGKAMAKDPAQRYATCLEFVEALKAAPAPQAQPAPPLAAKAKGRRWLRVAGLVAGVLAVCVLPGYLLLRRHQAVQAEVAYWDAIRGAGDAARFEQYLKEYPTGRFAELARKEMEAVRRRALGPPMEKKPPEQAGPTAKSPAIVPPAQPAAGSGTLRVAVSPAGARVTAARGGESPRPISPGAVELEEGSWTLVARAPGHQERSQRVQIAAGQTASVELVLARGPTPRPAEAVKAGGMEGFENPQNWTREGEWYVRRGGNLVLHKHTPEGGTFTFTILLASGGGVFRGKRLEWVVDFRDPRNHLLLQLDKDAFVRSQFVNGRKTEVRKPHGLVLKDQMTATVEIEVTRTAVTHRLRKGEEWAQVDTLSVPGQDFTVGRFGLIIQGRDEVRLSGFSLRRGK